MKFLSPFNYFNGGSFRKKKFRTVKNSAFPNYFLSSPVSFSYREIKNNVFVAKVTIA